MPFWRAYYHLIWATKNRLPLITPEIERQLYLYLTSKAGELGVHVYAINGWNDHLHMIVSIPPKHAVAYVVKSLKGASAFSLNQQADKLEYFAWQRGYGVLTLGERQLERAIDYVANQKMHHHNQTTNRWLERVDELDDEPVQTENSETGSDLRIREQRAKYEFESSLPF